MLAMFILAIEDRRPTTENLLSVAESLRAVCNISEEMVDVCREMLMRARSGMLDQRAFHELGWRTYHIISDIAPKMLEDSIEWIKGIRRKALNGEFSFRTQGEKGAVVAIEMWTGGRNAVPSQSEDREECRSIFERFKGILVPPPAEAHHAEAVPMMTMDAVKEIINTLS